MASPAYMTVKIAMFTTQCAVNTNGNAQRAEHERGPGHAGASAGSQRSPLGYPNSPCGRTSRTAISTMKNVNEAQVGEISAANTASVTPMSSAATIAPPRLPIPPSTMIVSSREIRS